MPKFPSFFCCGNKKNLQKQDEKLNLLKEFVFELKKDLGFLDSMAWRDTQRCVQVDLFGISNILGWHTDLAFSLDHTSAKELIDLLTPTLKNIQNRTYLAKHMAQQIICALLQIPFESPIYVTYVSTKAVPEKASEDFRKKFWENMDEKSIDIKDVTIANQAFEKLIFDTIKKIGPDMLFARAQGEWERIEKNQKQLVAETINPIRYRR